MFKKASELKIDDVIDLTPIFEWFESQGIDSIDEVDKISAESEYAVVDTIEFEKNDIVYIGNTLLDVAVPVTYMVEVANA